jgi:hypothetical protein
LVDDLVLLDRQGEQIDLLELLDALFLDESSELGDGDPGADFILLLVVSASSSSDQLWFASAQA